MAIELECINFIVPRKTIEEKYPGGWDKCLKDHKGLIGGRVWYDNYLFRDGAMNPMDIESLIDEWTELGFQTHAGGDNPSKWIDVCVVDTFGGLTLPCDWITVQDLSAAIKGESANSEVVGRNDFKKEQEAALIADQDYLLNN